MKGSCHFGKIQLVHCHIGMEINNHINDVQCGHNLLFFGDGFRACEVKLGDHKVAEVQISGFLTTACTAGHHTHAFEVLL